MPDIIFEQIAPRSGGQREAFEELCCQIARHKCAADSKFTRLRGAGGDGGVECFIDLPNGSRIGWQAKFVFDLTALISQLNKSLKTALEIHPSLEHYIICFPFDLTGPTARKGKSAYEKFEEWRLAKEASAQNAGRKLRIEAWSASKISGELLAVDPNGGIREFFFNQTILSNDWFHKHLAEAQATAGPRYAPELNVNTPLLSWFDAFGQTRIWENEVQATIKKAKKQGNKLRSALDRTSPDWPKNLRAIGESCFSSIDRASALISQFRKSPNAKEHIAAIAGLLADLSGLEAALVADIDSTHGQGYANSIRFRQFMAEYMCTFPAANLDLVREIIKVFQDIQSWMISPAGALGFETRFILLGPAGSGKTHGICDVATQRMRENGLSCIVFGHQFAGEPDPWTRLAENLALPQIGRDGILDALNSAGEASGAPLLLFVDAINETRPLQYWQGRISNLFEVLARKPFLRICLSCRTSFRNFCLPAEPPFFTAEHQGFSGLEREACNAFFSHFHLEPPVTPILQPEFANPLYLKLVCSTMHSAGYTRLPTGWVGLAATMKAFIAEKERLFSIEHEITVGAGYVSRSLTAIAKQLATDGESAILWSRAESLLDRSVSGINASALLSWLVRADLLIEDTPKSVGSLGVEYMLRPAFERLGDFLIARELLLDVDSSNLAATCDIGGRVAPYFVSEESVEKNNGIISALSILVPEEIIPGKELSEYVKNPEARQAALRISIESYPYRNPQSFSDSTSSDVKSGLAKFGFEAMDSILSVSWQDCFIDAYWLHCLLSKRDMTERDEFWCAYLYDRYEHEGPVQRLIRASFDLSISKVDIPVIERWAILLLWFTAAADRRVRDLASRGAIALFRHQPQIMPEILERLLEVDDEYIKERTISIIYGACIDVKADSQIRAICRAILRDIHSNPENYNNAIIRDLVTCFSDLAKQLGEKSIASQLKTGIRSVKSPWPLTIPSDEEMKSWGNLRRLEDSCLRDDFFIYSMNCLSDWEHKISKENMGKWILQQIVQVFGYSQSNCDKYDEYILTKYGHGRAHQRWAERIGKKYQWIALSQLAAPLSDHLTRKKQWNQAGAEKEPLILPSKRMFDPTLPGNISPQDSTLRGWWFRETVDFSLQRMKSDKEWAKNLDDLPNLSKLLSLKVHNGQQWVLAHGYNGWSEDIKSDDDDEALGKPYRRVIQLISGYLIKEEDYDSVIACLRGRNFYGRWMPDGMQWLYGFAGEYPWGSLYDAKNEDFKGFDSNRSIPFECIPAASTTAVEWEYDASVPRNFHMQVPARILFNGADMWWNGKDGFRLNSGRTVFCDPSVTQDGATALVADLPDLVERLSRLKRRLIWTMLGEKLILGNWNVATPRSTFSQIAALGRDGSIQVFECRLFEHEEESGPNLAALKTPKKPRVATKKKVTTKNTQQKAHHRKKSSRKKSIRRRKKR